MTDLGAVDANGSWVDSVYLSTTPTITASSVLLGSVTHTGGLTATSNYNASLTAAVPAFAPGNYYVLVEADSHFHIADSNRANNTLAATTGQLAVSVPGLTLGAPASGSFTAADQDEYYQVTVPPGGTLLITLTSTAASGATALYVSQGSAPTLFNYQFAATVNQPNQTLSVPNASGGTYYFLIHSVSGAAATAGYTLTVDQTSALVVSGTSLSSGGNAGNVTVEVDGTNFAANVTANFTLGNTTIAAASIDYVNTGKFFATFDLAGAAAGAYSLSVAQGGQTAIAPKPFQVIDAAPGTGQLELALPAAVRRGRTAPVVVTYTNMTSNDLPAPLLSLFSPTNSQVLYASPASPGTFVMTAQIVAPDPNGPAGIIPPGQSGQLTFIMLANDTTSDEFIETQLQAQINNTSGIHNASIRSAASQASEVDGPWPPPPPGDTPDPESHDPNALVGPVGFGAQEFIKPQGTSSYTVEFENDGSVAAQDVTVTQQLDPSLNWSTFQLGTFGFGPINFTVPAGLTQYQTTVAYHNVDNSPLSVIVALNFNVQTGLLTVAFTSLDRSTGLPPNGVSDGFLPPDNSSGTGEGYVEYTVQPKLGLTTGTAVNAAASVIFDTNSPVNTKTFTNTIDAGMPTSSVSALPAKESSSSFTVSWSGTDDSGGSGIANYSVFVSDNGGPFTTFETNTTATSAMFTGFNGHTYGFYSVATDNVGNVQPTPTAAQATTNVMVAAVLPTSSVAALPATESSTSFTVSWSGTDAGGPGIATYDVFVSDNGGPFTAFQTKTTATSATFTGQAGHSYGFYSVATDTAGNAQPTPTAAQATTTVQAKPFLVTDHTYVIGSSSVTVSAANGLLSGDTGPTQLSATAGTLTGAQGGTFTINADGSFSYTPAANFPGYDSTQVTVTDSSGDKGTETVTVVSQHAGVVWKFYESVLNRTPDPGGLQYWTNYFDNGGSTGDMAFGFFESDELLNKVLGNYYEQYLLRPLDPSGLDYWKGIWHATGGPEQIKAGFADSTEFYKSSGGTPDSWIDALYQRILSRTPDPSGKTFWLNYYQQQVAAGVDSGTVRYQIALGFFDSAESYGQDVVGWFEEYLFRAPTDAEKAQYVSQMEGGASDRTIEQAITNLPEYASNPPTPADGSAEPLGSFYETTAQSQAAVAAKDAFFDGL